MAGNRAEFTKVLQVIYMLRVPYAFYLEGASKTLHNHTYIMAYIRPSGPWENVHKGFFFFLKKIPSALISTWFRLWQEPLFSNLHFPYGFPSADIDYAYNQNVLACFTSTVVVDTIDM